MNNLPDDVLLKIFGYLSTVKDYCRCSCVCRRWHEVLNTDSRAWEQLLTTCTPEKYHKDPLLRVLDSAKARLIAFHFAWSENDHSCNVYVKENKLTLHRNPVAQSSDAIRSKRGFTQGQHYWTVIWHGPKFGSSSVVGVATKRALLQDSGYYALLGCDKESWGWDISENVIRHNGKAVEKYPQSCSVKVNRYDCLFVNLTSIASVI